MNDTTQSVKPKIWITRTAPAAFKSADLWVKEGFATEVAPVLEVSKPREQPDLPVRDGVIIFTSGNAAKAFADMTLLRHWPVVTPGYQTQRISHGLGVRTVTSANGTSEDVTKLVMEKYTTARPIFHCSGNHVRGSITEDLAAVGYRVRRDVYYLSTPVAQMPNIRPEQMDYVALYSPLAAKILAGFTPDLTGATLLCLSPAVEEALGDLPCKARLIAESPNELSLIDTLKPV